MASSHIYINNFSQSRTIWSQCDFISCCSFTLFTLKKCEFTDWVNHYFILVAIMVRTSYTFYSVVIHDVMFRTYKL